MQNVSAVSHVEDEGVIPTSTVKLVPTFAATNRIVSQFSTNERIIVIVSSQYCGVVFGVIRRDHIGIRNSNAITELNIGNTSIDANDKYVTRLYPELNAATHLNWGELHSARTEYITKN